MTKVRIEMGVDARSARQGAGWKAGSKDSVVRPP